MFFSTLISLCYVCGRAGNGKHIGFMFRGLTNPETTKLRTVDKPSSKSVSGRAGNGLIVRIPVTVRGSAEHLF